MFKFLGVLSVGIVALGLAYATQPVSAAGTPYATVNVGEYWFCSSAYQGSECQTTVPVGSYVQWNFSGTTESHTASATGGSFNSGVVPAHGPSYKFQFNTPGSYTYVCALHPNDMKGKIVVTTTVGGHSELADISVTGAQAASRSGIHGSMIAAAAALLTAALGVFWFARRRRVP